MFGIFKRIRELEQLVSVLNGLVSGLQNARVDDYKCNRTLALRLTVHSGWTVRRFVSWFAVKEVTDNGVVVLRDDGVTEVIKWEDIADARPPKEDAR